MTLLPIVGRELRVAARRAGTYWLRCVAAAIALALGGSVLLASKKIGAAEMGRHLLYSLGVLTFGFSLFAGIFMTSDCVAEEKREGTLGLLFLTDLKAYDVVLGKLAATSLHAVFGLAAVVPMLGLPLLMGGVTGSEFGRLLLVFGNTLFFSLNLGMLVSVHSGEARQAFTRGILWLVIFAAVFPLLRWLLIINFRALPYDFLFWPSPVCAFYYGFDLYYRPGHGAQNFWISTALIFLLSCVFLVWTNLALPRCWRQLGGSPGSPTRREKIRGAGAGIFVRRRVYRLNPVFWLAMGDASGGAQVKRALRWLMPLWCIFLAASIFSRMHVEAFVASLFTLYGLHVLVKVLYVAEASQRMFQERQSSTFELLLVTPIPVREILAGQREALKKKFKGAFIALCVMNFLLAWETLVFGRLLLDMSPQDPPVFMEIFIGGTVMLWLDLRALCWVGMWRGLNARRGHRAILATLGQVMGIPWLLIFFIVFTESHFNSAEEAAVSMAIWFLAAAVIDLVSGYAAKRALETKFRTAVLQRFQPGQA